MSITSLEKTTRHGRRAAEAPPSPEVVDLATPFVLAAVEEAQRRRLSWALSADPEDEPVVRTSLGILARFGWTSLHRLTWPGADADAVAHVAVGPGGVVVVDERRWTGTVRVDGDALRLDGYRCDRELAALGDAVAAVRAELAPEHRSAVSAVVCVTTRDFAPEPVAGVHVVGRLHLASLLAAMDARLTPMDVADITRRLAAAADGAADGPPSPAPTPAAHPSTGGHAGGTAWPPVVADVAPAATHAPAPTTEPADPPGHDSHGATTGTVFLPADIYGTGPAAYFGARPVGADRGVDGAPAVPAQPTGAAPGGGFRTSGGFGGQRWRSGAARVTIALLVGLLTYQNSEAIAVAVGDWLGVDAATSIRAAESPTGSGD